MNLSGALNPKSVLVVSLPASELEMTEADVNDFERLTKMLDRVGKAMTITAGAETSEIIRRRLFDWDTRALNTEGRVILTKDAQDTCYEFARWVGTHSTELSSSIPADHARAHFEACYPFHPCALSVFERKWQSVPKFQQTRGILRLLALWIQHAYTQAYRKAHPDPLLTLGTAPFSEPLFRTAVFEQLGSRALETAVTVDIAGRKEAHSISLDAQAIESIQKERLHQKVATAVFFESNGGTTRSEATLPEIRLAVGHPDMDLGNVETALDGLTDRCYYLTVERKNYKFSLKENLNKRYSDKRANIAPSLIEDTVKQEIQKQFAAKEGIERVFFPERSNQVLDRPVITFVICDMAHTMEDAKTTTAQIEQMTREYGTSARTFKSALVWVVAESPRTLRDEARRLLAWEAIDGESGDLNLDETQRRQLTDSIKKAQRDLKEAVWRSYNRVFLLGKDNTIQEVPLGYVTSSSADSPITNVINQLVTNGEFDNKGISVRLLTKNWPSAFVEWPTKSVRDAIYASPQFPRIVKGTEAIQNAITNGVSRGELAYVGKTGGGGYKPFDYNKGLAAIDIEISEDMFILTRETAEAYIKKRDTGETMPPPQPPEGSTGGTDGGAGGAEEPPPVEGGGGTEGIKKIAWSGEIAPQKWMNFYTRVLSRFVTGSGLKVTVNVEVAPEEGVSKQKGR